MRKSVLTIVILFFSAALFAQQAMNNDSIIKLVKAGLSDDLIVSTINGSAGSYDTSADGIIALKTAGTSDKVVAAIVNKVAVTTQPVPAPIPPMTQQTQPVNPGAVQGVASGVNQTPSTQVVPPPPPFHSTDGKVRIYVTDHPIFESNGIGMASGNRHGASAAGVTHTQAGDDPRTVEVQADILKVCPNFVMASNNPDRADYVLVFRRRGGERSSMFAFGGLTGLALSAAAKVDGASLFENNGDKVYASKQTSIEKTIRDVCAHISPPSQAPVAPPIPTPTLIPAPAAN